MQHREASVPARPRLLLVEDSFTVAEGLKVVLEGLGFAIVGMAGTVEKAVALVGTRDFELAIVDINLHGETAAPVVSALQQRGKPLVYLSGYSDTGMLPSHLRGYPHLGKPIDPDALAAVLRELLHGGPVGMTSGDDTARRGTIGRSAKDEWLR